MLKKSAILIAVIVISVATSLTVSLQASGQDYNIPNWIKNNAKWWAEGQIEDSDFVQGIQYLIKQDIMKIPETQKTSTSNQGIPAWIKNNAKWWSEGQIGDSDFVQGIQYLVQSGIMDVGVTTSVSNVADYTVLVYMVASDLESEGYAATDDLNEMMQVGSSDSVNVIVESGGANAIPDDYREIDFTSVKRLYIEKENIKEISDLGRINMGDSKTLSDFLIWGIENYPAEKYLLVMWDHGGGINGFGNDEISGDDLQLDEIAESLASAREDTATNFELIGYDACLMATIEVASIAHGYSNYLVASEEIEPGHGWDYTAILDYITKNHGANGKEIGKRIADSYLSHSKSISSELGFNEHRLVTLSVTDLSKIPSLIDSINDLAVSLDENLTYENYYYFSASLFESERYGVEEGGDSGHTDIKDVAKNLGINIPQIKNKSDKVNQKVTEAVVYSIKGESRPNANGLSMYQPITEEIEDPYYYEESQWESVEDSYQDHLSEDTVYPEIYAEFQGNSIVGQFSGEDLYSFNLYIVSSSQDDIIEILSTEEYDPHEYPNGEFVIDWDGNIPALCNTDECSPINLEYEWDDQTILAYVPVFVQASDIETSADLIYDISSDYPIFIGMWPDDEDESIYQRNILPLYPDDFIYTYTLDYNTATGESEYTPYEDPIRVDENFELTQASFPGTYQIILEVCDYSENCAYSDYFEFVVEE